MRSGFAGAALIAAVVAAMAKGAVAGTTDCGSPLNLGFHIQIFSSGLRAAVWYPTKSEESAYEYPFGGPSRVAIDAPVADCEPYPLIVFSHGFGGCSIQSVFFTEALARAGYIVVAPDHKDSKCKVDQPLRGFLWHLPARPFMLPGLWSPAIYADRAADIRLILDEMPGVPRFAGHLDRSRIGASGHSLGGYTVMGLAGGWSSWKDGRIKAALLMAPYIKPFLANGTIPSIHIPVMYQAGTNDLTITPSIRRPGGAYDASRPPKFFEEVSGAGHFDWTNQVCRGYASIEECNRQCATVKIINAYAIAFFDRYLKGKRAPLLEQSNPLLAESRHSGG